MTLTTDTQKSTSTSTPFVDSIYRSLQTYVNAPKSKFYLAVDKIKVNTRSSCA